MAEWWVEAGIGETRSALIENDRIVEARILPDNVLRAGQTVETRLQSVGADGRNAVAVTSERTEILLPQRPARMSEGARLRVVITRGQIPGGEPWKRPIGRAVVDGEAKPSDVMLGEPRLFPPMGCDRLETAGWSDLIDEARTGTVRFAGGELRLSVTPAMTLIDVDGSLPRDELAEAGAAAAGATICRLDIGGSIGIDLPTVPGKNSRQRAAAAIDAAMGDRQFERTAVNGFGFVQIVRPRRNASLLELAQDRARFEARNLLRRVAVSAMGARRITAHPQVIAVLQANPDWRTALERQLGGALTLRVDPLLAISAGDAQ